MSTPPRESRLRSPRGLDDLLLYRLGRLYATAGTMTLRVCEGEFGITRRQWRLLALLADSGPLQPSVLAERADLDRARTSRALSGLIARQLVEREVLASDRRLAHVSLSPRGRALHARMLPRIVDVNLALLEALSAAQVQQLDGLLGTLQQRAIGLLNDTPWPKVNRRRGRHVQD
jgi:DNA-binding MarR family transcriptional regulator